MSPYPHSLVLAPAANLLAIWTPVNGIDLVLMAREVFRELSRPDIPDLKGRIFRRADKKSRVRREVALVHGCHMTPQGGYESSGRE